MSGRTKLTVLEKDFRKCVKVVQEKADEINFLAQIMREMCKWSPEELLGARSTQFEIFKTIAGISELIYIIPKEEAIELLTSANSENVVFYYLDDKENRHELTLEEVSMYTYPSHGTKILSHKIGNTETGVYPRISVDYNIRWELELWAERLGKYIKIK